ncbi:CPBP family intramembrane glutamic endopeptidase [Streptobacillus moniliformis]|uniref:CPBP family intramembrane glutamic endopeptidase n=1 Tax=Streptobacillus moniliformis TaxID=34105 RepID=UPI0007E3DAE4|nr:type II CAAX endopeptidase family protein [Streptobacillus moniliformis]
MIKNLNLNDKLTLFFLTIGVILLSYFIGGFIEGFVSTIKHRPLNSYNILLISNLIALFIIYFVLKSFKVKIFEKEKITITKIISVVLITAVISLTIGFVINHFSVKPENEKQLEVIIDNINNSYIILCLVIVIPIVEEIMFRKILYNLFKNRYLGILISSILFALAHSPKSIFEFVPYFTLGIVFSGTYFLTGSFKLAILSHMVNNFIGILEYVI